MSADHSGNLDMPAWAAAQLGHLTSGRQRFRRAAECKNGVGLPTGMLHIVHPLGPRLDMLEDKLVDESLVDGRQHG